jgi:two-component system chemotaxis response regulator CheB
MSINVFIVDDSALVRQSFLQSLEGATGITVTGHAVDPIMAMDKFERHGWPDVIILDIEMPRMDGLTFLRKIMQERPTPVIICSTIAGPGSRAAAEALSIGAVEVIHKPSQDVKAFIGESADNLQRSIRAASMSKLAAGRKIMSSLANNRPLPTKASLIVENKQSPDVVLQAKPQGASRGGSGTIIAIGSSTGGVQVLEYLFSNIATPCPPIVVVQHMPAGFTRAMSERLDGVSSLHIKEAEDGDALLPNRVLIAPGDYHMMVKRIGNSLKVEVKEGAKVSRHRPSVDVLFRSCANEVGAKGVGVILTGMGDDGAIGMKEMRQQGSQTYAQSEATCTVFGMPKVALETGGAMTPLTPEQIVAMINKL